jgi:hypothetical protein
VTPFVTFVECYKVSKIMSSISALLNPNISALFVVLMYEYECTTLLQTALSYRPFVDLDVPSSFGL